MSGIENLLCLCWAGLAPPRHAHLGKRRMCFSVPCAGVQFCNWGRVKGSAYQDWDWLKSQQHDGGFNFWLAPWSTHFIEMETNQEHFLKFWGIIPGMRKNIPVRKWFCIVVHHSFNKWMTFKRMWPLNSEITYIFKHLLNTERLRDRIDR